MSTRRTFLRQIGTALVAAPALASVPGALARAATRLDSSAAGTFTSLRRGVGTFTERGGTIGWLVRDGAAVVVDTQYTESATNCWRGLQKRDAAGLAFVVNTHHHGDHTAGNPALEPHAGRIVAHANAPRLQKQSADARDDASPQVYADTTFEDEWSDAVADETVTLHHYGPAHTGGDTVIFFESANVVHVGDLVFNRAYPFIDVRGGADTANWMTTLKTLHDTADDDTTFIFGHGNPEFGVTGSRDDLLVMHDFLGALREYVTTQRQTGASLDEMKQTDVLDGFEAFDFDWALTLGQCIEAVYNEQTA